MPILFTEFFLYFLTLRIFYIFLNMELYGITPIGRKNLGGHHACLGDIVQNVAKMGVFAHFLRGAWGEFYKIWLKSNKFQSFRLILPIVNLTV